MPDNQQLLLTMITTDRNNCRRIQPECFVKINCTDIPTIIKHTSYINCFNPKDKTIDDLICDIDTYRTNPLIPKSLTINDELQAKIIKALLTSREINPRTKKTLRSQYQSFSF